MRTHKILYKLLETILKICYNISSSNTTKEFIMNKTTEYAISNELKNWMKDIATYPSDESLIEEVGILATLIVRLTNETEFRLKDYQIEYCLGVTAYQIYRAIIEILESEYKNTIHLSPYYTCTSRNIYSEFMQWLYQGYDYKYSSSYKNMVKYAFLASKAPSLKKAYRLIRIAHKHATHLALVLGIYDLDPLYDALYNSPYQILITQIHDTGDFDYNNPNQYQIRHHSKFFHHKYMRD